jgi:hypothetical protein
VGGSPETTGCRFVAESEFDFEFWSSEKHALSKSAAIAIAGK